MHQKNKIMAIEILSAKKFNVKLKATIQATGRLGFTEATAKFLNLSSGKHVKFAKDSETDDFFMSVCDGSDTDTFEVKVSSGYYYVPAKMLFDARGYDYVNKTIIFDMVRNDALDSLLGGETYKLNKREKERKDKDNEDITE